jgi:hypothetical protein
MKNRNNPNWTRIVICWILSNLLVLVFGSFATYSWSHHIHPIWADIVMSVTGEKCCFKATVIPYLSLLLPA